MPNPPDWRGCKPMGTQINVGSAVAAKIVMKCGAGILAAGLLYRAHHPMWALLILLLIAF